MKVLDADFYVYEVLVPFCCAATTRTVGNSSCLVFLRVAVNLVTGCAQAPQHTNVNVLRSQFI